MAEICFSHETALQLVRDIGRDKCPVISSPNRSFPRQTSSNKDSCLQLRSVLELLRCVDENCNTTMNRYYPPHCIAQERHKGYRSTKHIVHTCERNLPVGSLLQINRDIVVCAPELAFVQIVSFAKPPSFLDMLLLAYEICGHYQTFLTSSSPSYQVAALSSKKSLTSFAANNPSFDGSAQALRILRYVEDGSQSFRETALALLLGLPNRYGGYGLGMPKMNWEIRANEQAFSIGQRSSFRCDLSWVEFKLDVEYQSKEMHANENARVSDSRRVNALISMGWKTICITNEELESPVAMDAIADNIRKHLKIRKRVYTKDFRYKQQVLREKLGLPAIFLAEEFD